MYSRLANNSDRVVTEFDKNRSEKARITLCPFIGKQYVDIRTFYPNENNELRPGKGFRISADYLPELIAALQEAQRIVEE